MFHQPAVFSSGRQCGGNTVCVVTGVFIVQLPPDSVMIHFKQPRECPIVSFEALIHFFFNSIMAAFP